MKTSELTGPALDWAVAKCEGVQRVYLAPGDFRAYHHEMNYCKDWAQGGPIIEREKICVSTEASGVWMAWVYDGLEMVNIEHGPTPLIAAMRCLVTLWVGDEIELPQELL